MAGGLVKRLMDPGTTHIKLEQLPGWAGGEVTFFATATIDGCSVYIEGPADTPKFTHANAQAVQPTLATDTFSQKQVKIQAMDARLQNLKKGPATVVERPAYMIEDPVHVQAAKQQFSLQKGLPLAQFSGYSPYGAVVGVKGGDTWSVFMQKCGAFDYTSPGAGAQRSYIVPDAQESFPNGGASVRMMP